MLRSSLILCLLSVSMSLWAQAPRTIVVEHFTNTRCSICASRNPGFFNNLNSEDSVLHLTFHPSAPYSSCIHYLHNPNGNDGRTNYYGVYGGTPRLVIQGEVISASTNYSSSGIFDPYRSATSPVSIRIEQNKDVDSMRVRVIVKTLESNNLANLRLMVAAVEDTIFYSAPNGESEQYNVFRQEFTSVEGDAWTLASTVGDSTVYTASLANNPDWDMDHMFAMAILQDETSKTVLQASASAASDDNLTMTTSVEDQLEGLAFEYYPNPVSDQLTVRLLDSREAEVSLFRLTGQMITTKSFVQETQLDFRQLASGIYLLQVRNEQGQVIRR
ncbi:MAG: T9SS type A sorting domain-containing protein, partial [Bacteroidota bacterium]